MLRATTRLRFIDPQLATPVDEPPEGKHWIHEIKHDGYRCQVLLQQGQARVFTRNGHGWTDRFPSIVRAAANPQLLMVRPLSRTVTARLTSKP